MTTKADILGRPPVMRRIAGQDECHGFDRGLAEVTGRVVVRVPPQRSCMGVGDGAELVTMAAFPWEAVTMTDPSRESRA